MPPDSENAERMIRAVETAKQGGSSPEVGLQYALTDQGNGERLAKQHGEDLRYVAPHKKWYVFGRCVKGAVHWVADNTGEVMRRAKQVAVDIAGVNGVVNIKQPELDKWSLASQDSGALRAMIELARSERPCPATPEMFDTDPMLFQVHNGTINLLTGEFYESRREDMITKCAGTRFVSEQQTANSKQQESSDLKFQISETKEGEVNGKRESFSDSDSTEKAEGAVPSAAHTLHRPESALMQSPLAGSKAEQSENSSQRGGGRVSDSQSLQTADLNTTLELTGNPEALCPTWESFLRVVQDDDEEMIQFLQRCVGYSMTGLVKERVLLILYGGGANGKSTFIETLHALLGDYATVTPIDTLLAKKFGNSIPNDIAALKGVRFVSASETDENAKLATGKIKSMTGGGRLSARFMGGEFFNFQTTFKLWLETNHKPRIPDSSKAMFDRIRLVPFKVRIPEEKQDKELKDKLLRELPGILNWALAGVKQYQEIGLAPPAKVVEETARYQKEQDVLGNFLADRYEEKPGGFVSKDEFYRDWKEWCAQTGEFAISKNTLGRRMNDRNFDPDRRERLTAGGKLERVWEGIVPKPAPATAVRPGNATLNYDEDDL